MLVCVFVLLLCVLFENSVKNAAGAHICLLSQEKKKKGALARAVVASSRGQFEETKKVWGHASKGELNPCMSPCPWS